MNRRELRQTHLHFAIFGDELLPQRVTDQLGIEPDRFFSKGDKISPNGDAVRRRGTWQISSSVYVDSWEVDDHLEWLVETFEGHQAKLREFLDLGYSFRLQVCWVDRGGNGGPWFSREYVQWLGEVRVGIAVNWYEAEEEDRYKEGEESED
jgi:hypothetical protein